MADIKFKRERLTQFQKESSDFKWYKDRIDELNILGHSRVTNFGEVTKWQKLKVNYDLYNNIINLKEFDYVCKPDGDNVGDLPATMVNRDIVSGKIKAICGMEAKRPFSYKVLAVNPEATSRKEQKTYDEVKTFVQNSIVGPIRKQIEEEKLKQLNPNATEQDIAAIQKQIDEELQARTPPEVKKYMEREYQDPSEVQGQQLLNYFLQEENLRFKFNKMFLHATLSAVGAMYVGIIGDGLATFNINSLRFECDSSQELDFIEDGEWATYEHRWGLSQVIRFFGKELTDKQIDELTEYQNNNIASYESVFDFNKIGEDVDTENTFSVRHFVWKSLRKIGFLSRWDAELEEVTDHLVEENYRLNKDVGDLEIEWEWIPEVHEGWKIKDIYLSMQPIPGQFKDINNLYECKLPYVGAIYDKINSTPTAIMDRLKYFQYFYDTIIYRVELLMASDEGKKVLMNINAVPDTAEMSLIEWKHFAKSSPYMFYDPNSEGSGYSDANTIAKVLDLSLASDISKYLELAENIRQQAGRAVGITDQVEGAINGGEAVTNVQQNLIQSSNILEPYFMIQDAVKKNILQAVINCARVVYSGENAVKLSYVLDDMSLQMLSLDTNMLDSNTLGVYVASSSKADEAKKLIESLAHAAMQTQQATLSDVIDVLRQDGIIEAQETMKKAEDRKAQQLQAIEQQKVDSAEKLQNAQLKHEETLHKFKLEEIRVKEQERRETELQKAALMGASFNPDQDVDNDGVNDFIEIFKNGVDAEVKKGKLSLDQKKLEHQMKIDKEKIKLENKKISTSVNKKS